MNLYKSFTALILITFLLILLWQVLLNNQSRNEQQAQINILAQAPCLATLCPGFVGREQMIIELSHLEFVQGKLLGSEQIGLWFFEDNIEQGKGSGRVYFATDSFGNQTVSHMLFSLNNLSLGTVLDTLGEPEEFLFVSGCGMGKRVYAKLLYPDRGVEINIEYPTRRPASQSLADDTPVVGIGYFSPKDAQTYIVESLKWYMTDSVSYDLAPSTTEDDILQQLHSWPGLSTSPIPTADFCPR